jgi:hypothetical protein
MEWGAEETEKKIHKPVQVTFGLPKNFSEALDTAARSADSSRIRPDGG